MNYVYRYIDTADNIIKYIGIVCRNSIESLKRRIIEHSNNDLWCQGKTWRIEYITVPTKNDAHALEGHFIALYGTSKYFNRAKTSLGLLSFVKDNFEWKLLYDSYTVGHKEINSYKDDIFIVSTEKIPTLIAEKCANIIHSLKVVDEMLENEDYSLYSKYELEADKELLSNALKEFDAFLDNRDICLI